MCSSGPSRPLTWACAATLILLPPLVWLRVGLPERQRWAVECVHWFPEDSRQC